MNVQDRKRRCKKHHPKFEKQEGGSVIYFCGECGWRGKFNVGSMGAR